MSEQRVIEGDCLALLPTLAAGSVDCVVTDPPYGIAFMGKHWDQALPDPAIWRALLRVVKPGGFAAVMSSARMDCLWRMARDLEEAGWDVGYSMIGWVYCSGFPKGLDCGKAFDAEAGAEREVMGERRLTGTATRKGAINHVRAASEQFEDAEVRTRIDLTAPATPLAQQWDGWKGGRQALKPALEAIIICQKPGEKRIIDNLREHGVGAFNCREAAVPFGEDGPGWDGRGPYAPQENPLHSGKYQTNALTPPRAEVRYPANLVVSDNAMGERSKFFSFDAWAEEHLPAVMDVAKPRKAEKEEGCEGFAARAFTMNEMPIAGVRQRCRLCGKWRARPMRAERHPNSTCLCEAPDFEELGPLPTHNPHPTVKPVALMAWLASLLCPPGGTVLDPFLGSGTTLVACAQLGLNGIGIEREAEYCEIARARIAVATQQGRLELGWDGAEIGQVATTMEFPVLEG